MTNTVWTPDQPLRHDATDEQIIARFQCHPAPGTADEVLVSVVREYAAACVRHADSALRDENQRLRAAIPCVFGT